VAEKMLSCAPFPTPPVGDEGATKPILEQLVVPSFKGRKKARSPFTFVHPSGILNYIVQNRETGRKISSNGATE
jgi:hypothetical protein